MNANNTQTANSNQIISTMNQTSTANGTGKAKTKTVQVRIRETCREQVHDNNKKNDKKNKKKEKEKENHVSIYVEATSIADVKAAVIERLQPSWEQVTLKPENILVFRIEDDGNGTKIPVLIIGDDLRPLESDTKTASEEEKKEEKTEQN